MGEVKIEAGKIVGSDLLLSTEGQTNDLMDGSNSQEIPFTVNHHSKQPNASYIINGSLNSESDISQNRSFHTPSESQVL